MKRSRVTEDQIIGILKEHEAGISVADLCRKHGVSDGTVYKWKAKYGGMDVSEAKRLKGLEDENARLKRLLADAMRDNAALPTHGKKTMLHAIANRRFWKAATQHASVDKWQVWTVLAHLPVVAFWAAASLTMARNALNPAVGLRGPG